MLIQPTRPARSNHPLEIADEQAAARGNFITHNYQAVIRSNHFLARVVEEAAAALRRKFITYTIQVLIRSNRFLERRAEADAAAACRKPTTCTGQIDLSVLTF
jgi:hypothetical protein